VLTKLTSTAMRIERIPVPEGSAFRIAGELSDDDCPLLRRMLAGPASDTNVTTLDLGKLETCGTTAIEVLVDLTARADRAEGYLVLRSVSDDVLRSFVMSDAVSKLHIVRDPVTGNFPAEPRYLFRIGETTPFAYASSRHDFTRFGEEHVWAHQSHDWLIEAGSGTVLAHRTRTTYFSAETGARLYSEHPAGATEPA
jgi:anti-anti-sigma regulatory factor